MVGLSTAWFLQQHGLHVTVCRPPPRRRRLLVGNAGWLTPALTGAAARARGAQPWTASRAEPVLAGVPCRCA